MQCGEFELIERIRRRAAVATGAHFGIGDDCAAQLVPAGQELLTSTDLLLENIHFRLDWTDLYDLGIKAVAVNISDIAAMGGEPQAIFLGLGLPSNFSDHQVDRLLDGIFAACDQYRVYVAGGDTCRSASGLLISITAQGVCPLGTKLTRGGAQAGDDLWVSGRLGDSALALDRLRAGETPPTDLARRHFRPQARVSLGLMLRRRGLATAMLDLSDGLCGDLQHILRAAQVGAQVWLEMIPLSADFRLALEKDPNLLELALNGGEDYELLFCAPVGCRTELEQLSHEQESGLFRIGTITAQPGLAIIMADGQTFIPSRRGFDHFIADEENR